MKLVFEPDHLDLFAEIQSVSAPDQKVFLVGGAVRDTLIGHPLHDMDFVMGANPMHLAANLAKRLEAGFFVLDDERHTARVTYHDRKGQRFPLDFVQYTGTDLLEDLLNRDFTINAMAVPVDALTEVIDPLNGQSDLAQGLLKLCSDHALMDDPVRVLRGVRMAVQFSLDYAPGLEAALKTAAAHLQTTTYERQRDEFFRILAGSDPAAGLRDCWRFGVFERLLLPVVDQAAILASPPQHPILFEHTIQTVERYHHLVKVFQSGDIERENDDWRFKATLDRLGKFSDQIRAYFSEEITPGRSKGALANFSVLLHAVGKPLTVSSGEDGSMHDDNHAQVSADLAWQMAQRLKLSNAEGEWVRKLVQHHRGLLPLLEAGVVPDRRTIFRFYNAANNAGVATVFHALADAMVTYGTNLDLEWWRQGLSVAEAFLSAWWEQREAIISPAPLLDGHDLQVMFGLVPGKQIGKLLALLVEEQVSGTISTRAQALDFIRKQLTDSL